MLEAQAPTSRGACIARRDQAAVSESVARFSVSLTLARDRTALAGRFGAVLDCSASMALEASWRISAPTSEVRTPSRHPLRWQVLREPPQPTQSPGPRSWASASRAWSILSHSSSLR